MGSHDYSTRSSGFLALGQADPEPNTASTDRIESEPSGGELERVCGESEERSEIEQPAPKVDEEPQPEEKGTKAVF